MEIGSGTQISYSEVQLSQRADSLRMRYGAGGSVRQQRGFANAFEELEGRPAELAAQLANATRRGHFNGERQ